MPSREEDPFLYPDTVDSLLQSYERLIENEADERLRVYPMLDHFELCYLHARHGYFVIHGEAPGQTELGNILGVPRARIFDAEGRCKRAGAVEGPKGDVAGSVGRVAVHVVQYIHHAWVEEAAPMLSYLDMEGEFRKHLMIPSPGLWQRIKHPSRQSLLPCLYGLLRSRCQEKNRLFSSSIRHLLSMERERVREGEVSIERLSRHAGVAATHLHKLSRECKREGLLSIHGTFVLTMKGSELLEKAVEKLHDWTDATKSLLNALPASDSSTR